MRATRTHKQIDADRLDLEIFRLIGKMEAFARNHREDEIGKAADRLFGERHIVRRHMHPEDREKTIG